MMFSDCIFFTEHLTLFFSCFSFITAIQYPKLAIQADLPHSYYEPQKAGH